MENLLGWLLVAVAFACPVIVAYAGYRLIKRQRKAHEKAMASIKTSSFEQAEFLRAQARASRLNLAKPTPAKMASMPKPTRSYTNSKTSLASTPSSTSSSNDSLLTDLATLYVLNSALQHGSASAKVDYDSGTITTNNSSSSSWGFDDDDSRKSSSSSFSSSDSSSSWDSSSSSSDSGPSSDW